MDLFQQRETHSPTTKREEMTTGEVHKHRGLCSTCKKTSTCTYPRDPERPISFCCEHEGYEACEGSVSLALLRAGSIFPGQPDTATKTLIGEGDSGVDKGLCRNCANREFCTFPRPEGGVWHCNEYR